MKGLCRGNTALWAALNLILPKHELSQCYFSSIKATCGVSRRRRLYGQHRCDYLKHLQKQIGNCWKNSLKLRDTIINVWSPRPDSVRRCSPSACGGESEFMEVLHSVISFLKNAACNHTVITFQSHNDAASSERLAAQQRAAFQSFWECARISIVANSLIRP